MQLSSERMQSSTLFGLGLLGDLEGVYERLTMGSSLTSLSLYKICQCEPFYANSKSGKRTHICNLRHSNRQTGSEIDGTDREAFKVWKKVN